MRNGQVGVNELLSGFRANPTGNMSCGRVNCDCLTRWKADVTRFDCLKVLRCLTVMVSDQCHNRKEKFKTDFQKSDEPQALKSLPKHRAHFPRQFSKMTTSVPSGITSDARHIPAMKSKTLAFNSKPESAGSINKGRGNPLVAVAIDFPHAKKLARDSIQFFSPPHFTLCRLPRRTMNQSRGGQRQPRDGPGHANLMAGANKRSQFAYLYSGPAPEQQAGLDQNSGP